MRNLAAVPPTLFKVVTHPDDFTYEDLNSSKMLYLVNAEFRGQQVTKQRVLKDLVKHMQDGSLRGERNFGSFGFGHSLKWGRGLSRVERDTLYERNVNVVSMHPGLGPLCHSHNVRENIHFINLVSMVTAIEHLLSSIDSDHFRTGMLKHPSLEWVNSFIDHSLSYVLQHLTSARYISLKGAINTYVYNRLADGMSLAIGGLRARIKIDEYLQVWVTYDERTRAMVKDNYGDDFIYD